MPRHYGVYRGVKNPLLVTVRETSVLFSRVIRAVQ